MVWEGNMNTKDAVNYIKTLFNNYWGQQLKYKCGYDNVAMKTPNDQVPYAELNVIHVMADQATLTGTEGRRRFRQTGYVTVSIYVPSNTAMDLAYDLAQGTMNVFRRPPADCQINFSDFSFTEDDERYRDFFRIIVKMRFDYDYIF